MCLYNIIVYISFFPNFLSTSTGTLNIYTKQIRRKTNYIKILFLGSTGMGMQSTNFCKTKSKKKRYKILIF